MKKDNNTNYFKLLAKKILCVISAVGSSGRNVYISPLVELKNPRRITLGEDVVLERHCRLYANGKTAKINIGDNTTISPFVLLKCNGGVIEIGRDCSINDYTVFNGYGGIHIGDDVHIATHAAIIASEHPYEKLGTEDFTKGILGQGVSIESSVWIGTGVIILDGVTIGTGSVVGAGTVVTKDIPPFSVAVGVPARVIKKSR